MAKKAKAIRVTVGDIELVMERSLFPKAEASQNWVPFKISGVGSNTQFPENQRFRYLARKHLNSKTWIEDQGPGNVVIGLRRGTTLVQQVVFLAALAFYCKISP